MATSSMRPQVDLRPTKTPVMTQARPKILLVDDDPNVVACISRSLRAFQVDVVCAYHGMQGIWLATTEKPNIVLTDLSMPWTAGEDLIETLVCHPATRDIPIIVLTGKTLSGDDPTLNDPRLSRIFFKPTPVDQILEEMRRHILLSPRNKLPTYQPRFG